MFDFLKRFIASPVVMPKRYLALFGVVVYIGLKVYVSFTVDPSDDNLPDRFKDVFLHVAMINHEEPNNGQQLHAESESSDESFYGEQG